MSQKLPRVSADKVVKVLEKIGFILVRQSGSHKIYKKNGVVVAVPYHSKKIIHPKILRNILRDADLTVSKFKNLMK